MIFNFENKVALVTGSSRGIGKSIGLSLIKDGCRVMFNGRKIRELQKTVKNLGSNADYIVADVTNPQDCRLVIKRIEKKWGKLDFLICNVGGGRSVSPLKEELIDWKNMFALNFFSTTNIVKESIPLLSKSCGAIVCISSIAGIENIGAPLPYFASKSALNSFVKGMAKPLAKKSIRINAVAPGNILFDGSVWQKKLKKDKKSVEFFLQREVALGRLGNPEEITPIVSFLLSDMSSFTTGSIFVIDGGQIRS